MLTVKQVADRLGVTVQRVRVLCIEGRLGAFKVGRDWLFRPETVDAFQQGDRDRRYGKRAADRPHGGRPRKASVDVVRLCPHCKAAVTRSDEQAGKCPGCGGVLLTLA